jgi:hypothetical protein
MLPAEWRYVFKQGSIDSPRSYQLLCGPFEIDRIPKRNGSDNEVQPARAVALVFEGAVSDFSQTIEEDGPRK